MFFVFFMVHNEGVNSKDAFQPHIFTCLIVMILVIGLILPLVLKFLAQVVHLGGNLFLLLYPATVLTLICIHSAGLAPTHLMFQ